MGYLNVPPFFSREGSGAIPDIIGDLLSSYTAGAEAKNLKPKLKAALTKQELENKWYGPEKESEIGLRGAQSGHYNALTRGKNLENEYARDNPLLSSTGVAGQIGALLYLQKHGMMNGQGQPPRGNQIQEAMENDQLYKAAPGTVAPGLESIFNNPALAPDMQHLAKQFQQPNVDMNQPPQNRRGNDYADMLQQSILNSINPNKTYAPSKIGKLQNEYYDVKSGFRPNTNRSVPFSSDEEQKAAEHIYEEQLGGLKPDQHFIYDPETNEKIGTLRPFTADERKKETGRAFFKETFPIIYKGIDEFIGQHSATKLNQYASQYGRDPIATQKIDDFLLAQKLSTATQIKEGATLNAGKTNQIFNRIASSFPESDIPKLWQKYQKEYRLPHEAFSNANERFYKTMLEADKNAEASVPQYKEIYFNAKRRSEEDKKDANEIAEHNERNANLKDGEYTENGIRYKVENGVRYRWE